MAAGEGELIRYEVDDVPGYGVLLPDGIAGLPFLPRGHHWLMNYTGFEVFRQTDPLLLMQRSQTLDEFDDPEIAELATLLADEWDREMRGDEPGALVFRIFSYELASTVLRDDISAVYDTAVSI